MSSLVLRQYQHVMHKHKLRSCRCKTSDTLSIYSESHMTIAVTVVCNLVQKQQVYKHTVTKQLSYNCNSIKTEDRHVAAMLDL